MLLKISEMPSDVKLCKILTADKITRKSNPLELLPQISDVSAFVEFNKAPPLKMEPLKDALWRMVRACITDDGIGLAAPQIGIFRRMFVIRESEEAFRAYLHPHYSIDPSSRFALGPEGCLSVPGKTITVTRATLIQAEWFEFNSAGQLILARETLEGLKARVYQHETDHLLGISILNRYEKQRKAKGY